jgi:hypothetical protein
MYQEALEEAERASEGGSVQREIRSKAIWGVINAMAGSHDSARKALNDLMEYSKPPDFMSASDSAYIHAVLGEYDKTLDSLEKADQGRASALIYTKLRPMFGALSGDPRFGDLLRRIGIPE